MECRSIDDISTGSGRAAQKSIVETGDGEPEGQRPLRGVRHQLRGFGGTDPPGRSRGDGDPCAVDGRRIGVLLQAPGVMTAGTLVATAALEGNER